MHVGLDSHPHTQGFIHRKQHWAWEPTNLQQPVLCLGERCDLLLQGCSLPTQPRATAGDELKKMMALVRCGGVPEALGDVSPDTEKDALCQMLEGLESKISNLEFILKAKENH